VPRPTTGDLAASHEVLETPATPARGTNGSPDTYGLLDEPAPETATPPMSVDPVRLASAAPVAVEDRPRLASLPVSESKAPAPRRLLVPGIYRFPWYRRSLQAWLLLSLGGTLVALILRLLMLTR
jgi:hypothetical protein